MGLQTTAGTRPALTERQLYALRNKVDRGDGRVHPNPAYSSRVEGRWSSMLVVGRNPMMPWLWEASVARLERGRPIAVRHWEPGWRDAAEGMLDDLLGPVGEDPFNIREYHLRLGIDPASLLAHSRWRTLTPDELRIAFGGDP